MSAKKLLVVLPGWLTDKTLRRKLERAGYIIVEAPDIAAVRILDPDPTLLTNDTIRELAKVALSAPYGPRDFGTVMLKKMVEAKP